MPKILLDLQTLQSNSRQRGIGNYSRGLADALLRRDDFEWHVLLSDAMPETLQPALRWVRERVARERVHVLHGLAPIRGSDPASAPRARVAEILYAGFVEALDVDLVHVASPFEGWSDETVLGLDAQRATAFAATIYDLIPFEQPELYFPTPQHAAWFERRLRGLSGAEAGLAISEHTAEVARARLGTDGIVSIGADVDAIFAPRRVGEEAGRALKARYRITKPFIVHVGIPEPRKNIERLIEAFARLPENVRAGHQIVLVTTVTDAQRDHLTRLAQSLNLPSDAIVLPGFVPDPDLADLYALAQVTVMPSLSEGFGLPLLEAMRCGCPVLGSNTTSIPEVIGRDDLTFDPHQVSEIAQRLERMLSDPEFRADAAAHGARQQQRFSWSASAERACDAFRQAVERRRRPDIPTPVWPETGSLTLGRHLLPLTHAADATRPAALVPWPEDAETLRTTLAETGPSLLVEVQANPRTASDEDDAIHGASRVLSGTDSFHPFLVATLAMTPGDPPRKGRLTWNSWSRACLRAPEPEPDIGLPEAAALLARRHPLLKAAVPLARWDALDPKPSATERAAAAWALADNHAPACAKPRLLVDVSELSQRDARSGIQRVVRNVLGALFAEPDGFAIVPVRRDEAQYRYAHAFTARFLGRAAVGPDSLVDFQASDTFLGLDFDALVTPEAVALLKRQHLRGVRLVHVLYDTLPLHRPDWWGGDMHGVYARWLRALAEITDGIACISQAVADDVRQVLVERRFLKGRSPVIGAFHLGADLDAAHPAASVDAELAVETPALFEPDTPVFVTVGTLEPRKGHAQLLDAAEILWARGHPAVFAIVGKRGWLVDDLIARIETHPERDRRLRWFEAVDDPVLAQVYRAGTAAILPSEGEGFGLPLVEAAHAGLPILARDLPVFKEIGGAHATYFGGFDGLGLADAIEGWLAAHKRGEAPDSAGIRPLTWAESAGQLMDVLRTVPHQP